MYPKIPEVDFQESQQFSRLTFLDQDRSHALRKRTQRQDPDRTADTVAGALVVSSASPSETDSQRNYDVVEYAGMRSAMWPGIAGRLFVVGEETGPAGSWSRGMEEAIMQQAGRIQRRKSRYSRIPNAVSPYQV